MRCHAKRRAKGAAAGAAADVNSLVSPETELPYDYYSMPFCLPPEGVRSSAGSINPGTILMGSRIENSPYNFTVKVPAAGCLVGKGAFFEEAGRRATGRARLFSPRIALLVATMQPMARAVHIGWSTSRGALGFLPACVMHA